MPAVAKKKVLRAGRNQLVLDRICWFARLSEAEGLEGQRVLVDLLIHVDRTSNGSNMGALGDQCAVRESEILHGLALQPNCKM